MQRKYRKERNYAKPILLLASVLLASGAAAGCSGEQAAQQTGAEPDGSAQGQQSTGANKVKITFSTDRSKVEEDNQTMQKLVSDYNALPSGKAQVELQLADYGDNGNDARTWVTTQLIGNNAPDIFRSRYLWTQEDYGKGLLTDFNGYLDKTTPYNDNKPWRSTFSDSIMNAMLVPTTDKIAGIPTFSNAVRLFYNKELFKKAGITDLPQTWEQFNEAQAKLKAQGITPMAIGTNKQGGDRPNWMIRYFSDQTVEKLIPQLDLDKNGSVTSNEIVFGVDSGLIDFTKQPFIDLFPIMKDWTQYWPKGFNGLAVEDADDMFMRGDAAMTLNLPGFSKQLKGLVDYGVMRVPYLTKKTQSDAEEKYYEVAAGNPDGVYAISKKIAPEKVEPAVDFLMYLTSPKVQQVFGEQLYKVPILKDAKFPDNIKEFLVVNEPFKMNLFGPAFSKNLYETFGKEGQLYLDGTLPLKDFAEKLNQAARKEADAMKASQGWSKENQYGTKK